MATPAGSETIIGSFLARAGERSASPLWYFQSAGRWLPITWGEARQRVEQLAAGLVSLGIEKGERVGLIGSNTPDWVIADYALQHIGAVVVPLYSTSPADQIRQVLERVRARFCVADSDELVGLIREATVSGFEAVIALHEEGDAKGLFGRGALLDRGRVWCEQQPHGLRDRLAELGPDDVATVVFTSGTGGDPKGVVLTNRNLLWAAAASARAVGVREREKLLSYLPLAHAFERVITTVIPLVATSEQWTAWFVPKIEQLPAAIRSVRPTIFVAVPSVWERMHARITTELASRGLIRRTLATGSFSAGRAAISRRDADLPLSPWRRLGATTARVVGRRVLRKVGLGRCWYAVSGAASLQPRTQQFFQALGLGLHQGWGLTETSALCTVQRADDLAVGQVGVPIEGVEIRLGLDGEVLVRGPNVFVGYEGAPGDFASAIDEDGFLHTGDVGRLTTAGGLEIVDRLKDVIVTAGGRKIPPRSIEDKLRGDPLIADAMVIGEGRPYLAALISIDGRVAKDLVGSGPSGSPIWEHPRIGQRIDRTIASVNRALSQAEQLHRYLIVPFGFPDHALTPTLKLKRRVVEESFANQIEELYA